MMEIAKILVGATSGIAKDRMRIPAGQTVGLTTAVIFTDPIWDDMVKTVVFRGSCSRIAEFDGETAVIPWEVLSEPNVNVYFGIFGHNPETGLQIPLIEVAIGHTERATDPQTDPGTDPTLPIWAQLQQDIEDLRQNGGSGGNVDLTGYATEQFVQNYAKGAASDAVSQHNTAEDSHNDIRLELKAINARLTAFFDSDDQTLDELSEIVAYITSNKALIESITTSKVSVADIIDNLITNVTNKPLSAAQGVVLKGLIDAVSNSLSNYQPKGDYALRSELPTVPAKVSAFTNDAGYLTLATLPLYNGEVE